MAWRAKCLVTAASVVGVFIAAKHLHGAPASVSVTKEEHRVQTLRTFQRKYRHTALEESHGDLPLTPDHRANYTLRCVFFVNCKLNENYHTWIYKQAKQIPHRVHYVEIVATSRLCRKERRLKKAHSYLQQQRPGQTLLHCYDEPDRETFEYHGIHHVWQLGQVHNRRDDVLIYMHSKGLTHAGNYSGFKRGPFTKPFFSGLGQVLEAFDIFPFVDKAGLRIADEGFIWYNFWYARGSYVNRVLRPRTADQITDRHYYERWLCLAQPLCFSPRACYSLEYCPANLGSAYVPKHEYECEAYDITSTECRPSTSTGKPQVSFLL